MCELQAGVSEPNHGERRSWGNAAWLALWRVLDPFRGGEVGRCHAQPLCSLELSLRRQTSSFFAHDAWFGETHCNCSGYVATRHSVYRKWDVCGQNNRELLARANSGTCVAAGWEVFGHGDGPTSQKLTYEPLGANSSKPNAITNWMNNFWFARHAGMIDPQLTER